jgi:acetyl esterase/lipase
VPTDPRTVLTRAAPPPDLTVAYGEQPDQVIDVRLPARPEGLPLVIFVHGGFWRARYDRRHAGPLAADLAARGWPVAVIEYRRVGQPGGGWPGTFDDAAAAIRRAPALVDAALAGRDRPPAPGAVLAGHSAGGQLALWYAATAPPPPAGVPATVAGVLALAPVADLTGAYAANLDRGAVADLLGGGPADVPERYAEADPLARPAPPVPVFLLHGDRDAQVPVEQSRRYAAAARATGADVELRELSGVEHFGLIDPLSSAWRWVTTALRTLCRRSLSIDAGCDHGVQRRVGRDPAVGGGG